MAVIGSAEVLVRPTFSGWNKAVGGATADMGKQFQKSSPGVGSRITSGIGGALKKGMKWTGAGAGAALGVALFKGFDRLKNIENARAKLAGLGHSAQTVEKIMGNALAAVKGTAFGMDEAASTAATMVAAGIKPGQDLEKTLRLVGDAATIGGVSLSEMGAIFGKVAASNKIQGDVINQLNDKGIPILQMLGAVMGKSSEEVAALASKGKIDFATFRKAMEQGLGGAALKSGDTTIGAFKNVQAALGRVGANLLSGVFPKFRVGFTMIIDALGPLEDKAKVAGAAIGTGLAKAVSSVAGGFKIARDAIALFTSAFSDKAISVPTALDAKWWTPIINLAEKARAIFDALVPHIVEFGTSMVDAFKNAGPLVGAIGQNFQALLPHIATVGRVLATVFVVALKAIPPVLTGVFKGLTFMMNILNPVIKHLDKIAVVITTLLLPALISKGVAMTVAAAKSVAAWALESTAGARSAAKQVVAHYKIALGWAKSAAAAIKSGAETVYVWGLMATDAIKSAAQQAKAWLTTQLAAARSAAGQVKAWALARAAAVKDLAIQAAALAKSTAQLAIYRIRVLAAAAASRAQAFGALVASLAAQTAALIKNGAVWVAQRIAMTAASVASKAMAAAQWLLNAAMTANPIGLIVAGLVLLVGGLILAYKRSATFRAVVQAVWAGIKKVALAVVNWFVKSALPALKKVFGLIATGAKLMWTGLKIYFNAIRTAFRAVATVAKAIGKNVVASFELLRKGIAKIISGLAKWLRTTWTTIRTTVTKIAAALRDAVVSRFEAIRTGITNKIRWIKAWLKLTWGTIRTIVIQVIAHLRDGIISRFEAIRTGIRDKINWVKKWMRTTIGGIRDTAILIVAKMRDGIISRFAAVRDWVRDKFSKVKDLLLAPFRGARDIVGKIMESFRDKIVAWAKRPVEFLIEKVYTGGIQKVFNKAAEAVKLKTRLPDVAMPFNTGGQAIGPGNGSRDTILAKLANREWVIKTRSVDQMERRFPGYLKHINDNGSLPGFAGGGLVGGSGRFSAQATQSLLKAQQMAGVTFNIFQRGYRPATSYSGTSHAGDAIDLGPVTASVVAALRRAGWAAWDRTGKGNWVPHIHGVPLPGYGHAGGSGIWQAQDYLKGGDGLGGKDNGPRGLIGKVGGALFDLAGDMKKALAKPFQLFDDSMLGQIAKTTGGQIRNFAIKEGLKLMSPLIMAGHGMIGSAAKWLKGKFGGYDQEQLNNASVIADVARKLGFGDRGAIIGIATSIVESGLRNLGFGDRDSVGLFQQRTPWGPRADRMDPARSASMFFNGGQGGQPGLRDKAWRTGNMGDLAQQVQVSGLPWRYGQEMDKARKIVAQLGKGYAGGTTNARRGLHWVGEREPELVNFRGREQVYNSDMLSRMGSRDLIVQGGVHGLTAEDVARELFTLQRQDEALHPVWA